MTIVYKPLRTNATIWYDGKQRLYHYQPIDVETAKHLGAKGHDVRYVNEGRPVYNSIALDQQDTKMRLDGIYDILKDKIQFYSVTVIRVMEV